jgi:hypothetical protein
MGGKNKDHKARDWHTISRRGPRSVSRSRGGAFRPSPDLLTRDTVRPLAASPEKGARGGPALRKSRKTFFRIINSSCASISTISAHS